MAKHEVKIADDIADILRASTIEGNTLKLGDAKLERSVYQRVMKVLEAAGGKWNRKAGHHIFPKDVEELFAEALNKGGIVNNDKKRQAFYTPAAIADKLIALVNLKPGESVLEPSAGGGALADAVLRACPTASMVLIESDLDEAQALRKRFGTVFNQDFLAFAPAEIYDVIVMNPPFTAGQDIAHVLRAFEFLKPGGRLAAIMAPGWQNYRTGKAEEFRYFVAEHGKVACTLPPGSFKESGTNVETVIVTLTKPVAKAARKKKAA